MNLILYRNCFLVGLMSAAAIGPIFVLVFNRGALYGFRKGFITALGAAIGDGKQIAEKPGEKIDQQWCQHIYATAIGMVHRRLGWRV